MGIFSRRAIMWLWAWASILALNILITVIFSRHTGDRVGVIAAFVFIGVFLGVNLWSTTVARKRGRDEKPRD